MSIFMAEMASLLKELQNGTNCMFIGQTRMFIGQTQSELANSRVNGVAAKVNTLIGCNFELGQVIKFNFFMSIYPIIVTMNQNFHQNP